MSFITPTAWIGYLPGFLTGIIPAGLLLIVFSIIQLLLSTWLLSGKKTFFAAIVSVLILLGIIISNFSLLDIIFRDVAILFMALGLAALSYGKTTYIAVSAVE